MKPKTRAPRAPVPPRAKAPESGSATTEESPRRPDVRMAAAKRALSRQIRQEMRKLRLGKGELAARMRTSRSAVGRLLDPENVSVTLQTLAKAAEVFGKTFHAGFR